MKKLSMLFILVLFVFIVTVDSEARWYDPETGRFLSEDPIGFSGGVNFYAYAGNNPVDFRDPLGLSHVTINIARDTYTSSSTTGTLTVNSSALGYSLELPWRDNAPFNSSIPSGSYFGTIWFSPRFNRDVIRLLNVPGRDDILIHPGNLPEDTEGCILPGTSRDEDRVNNSLDALNQILNIIRYTQTVDRFLGESTDIIINIR